MAVKPMRLPRMSHLYSLGMVLTPFEAIFWNDSASAPVFPTCQTLTRTATVTEAEYLHNRERPA